MSAALSDPAFDDAEREGAAAFVLSLRERGVMSRPVLRAMEVVPRHVFAPHRFADLARRDVALPLAAGQTMTAPATVAAMLVALDVRAGQRVLEVGTGSGYVTALLAEMGAEVRSLERHPALFEGARHRLAATGRLRSVLLSRQDGLAVPPEGGLFCRILLNGSVRRLPPALTERLGPGGRLVCAVAGPGRSHLATVVRNGAGALEAAPGARLRVSSLAEPMVDGAVARSTEL